MNGAAPDPQRQRSSVRSATIRRATIAGVFLLLDLILFASGGELLAVQKYALSVENGLRDVDPFTITHKISSCQYVPGEIPFVGRLDCVRQRPPFIGYLNNGCSKSSWCTFESWFGNWLIKPFLAIASGIASAWSQSWLACLVVLLLYGSCIYMP
jgi:hypothetical protein